MNSMEPNASPDPKKPAWGRWIAIPIVAAWVLSVMSWLKICSGGCEEADMYRLFGLPLAPIGIGYFTVCALAFLTRNRFRISGFVVAFLLAGALGSEFVFLWIQKYVIGKWCQLCVGIAISVFTACVLLAMERFHRGAIQFRVGERNIMMKQLAGKSALIVFVFLAGIGISATGLKKPDAFAAGLSVNSLAFGNTESNSEVYIITDWFCSACRVAEPEILKGAGPAMKKAKVVFIDLPIHRETLNFIPYNLSFMIREKNKYLEIREALGTLSRTTKEPTPEDVQASVSPFGVKYIPLNFADLVSLENYQTSVLRQYKIKATPTVVVADSKSGKVIQLNGSTEITSNNILKALDDVSGK